jgi:predicted CopG family antitoxin
MTRKLTITVSEDVYQGLHNVVGRRRISQFIEKLARPHVIGPELEAAYQDMAADEARERGALEWSEALTADTLGNDSDASR